MSDTRSRKAEVTLSLDATPDQVWKALTDPVELSNWFPLEARVEPGKGGSILLSWGEDFGNVCRIDAWDPPRHLRTSWGEATAEAREEGGARVGVQPARDDDATAGRLAVDYFLEGSKGRTVLRLVHSGFGTGPRWDKEYDGVSRGWAHELRSLRHYLSKHRGARRCPVWIRQPIAVSYEVGWSRLMGPDGLLRKGELKDPREGDRYAFLASTGDRFEGVVQVCNRRSGDFSGTVENLGDSLLRVAFEDCFGRPEAHLWVAAWNVPEGDLRALETRLRTMLAGLFPEKTLG